MDMDDKKIFGMLFKQVNDALEKRINNNLRAKEMTFAQVRVLRALYEKDDRMYSLKELEHILGVAQSTCAGLVSRLVQKKMVECYTDSADKRVKIVRLTPEGECCCVKGRHDLEQTEQTILKGLSEQERDQLFTLLQRVYQNVK